MTTALIIQGENTGNASAFISSLRNISSRGRTSSSVSWSPEAWMIKREAGPKQKSPDISSIIQEIVNRPDWSTDNSLVLIITGTGLRTAIPYDADPQNAPKLSVEYLPSN
jgi:hypothetical protein